MKNYKDYWAYKEVIKNYTVKVSKTVVKILFKDGDVYAEFKLKKDTDIGYIIYLNGSMLNSELEFFGTFDEAVSSCIYYFYTRF